MRSVSHQVAIGQAVVVHVTLGELLLVCLDFVKLAAHVGVTTADLTSKDMTALSGSPWLSITSH